MTNVHSMYPQKYRTIWISDIHLGTRDSKVEFLQNFLNSIECETLYLVGDIVDLSAMTRGFLYWPQAHNNIVRSILGKAKSGTRVVLIPGNHDDILRTHQGEVFGNIEIKRNVIHETRDGKKLLILHGDEFDSMLKCPKILEWCGVISYDILLLLNRVYNKVRSKMGKPYWSLSSYIKSKFNNANKHIEMFETVVSDYARKRKVDGVVCGHIHQPAMKIINGIQYYNDGDWVEHCSALVESNDGNLSLLYWTNTDQTSTPQKISTDNAISA